uniref:SOCS box domain-containing protein n=1 Tax=Arcella intermedia TaxID=1963864 RepID=A0A6B2LJ67_9EUKA
MIGDKEVGKKSLQLRLVHEDAPHISLIGTDFKCTTLRIDNYTIRLQLWDSSHESLYNLYLNLIRGAHGIFIVFDVTSAESFLSAKNWLSMTLQYCQMKAVIFLIGNKIDLHQQRKISTAEAEAFANHYKIQYFETSALDMTNIDQLLYISTTAIIESFPTSIQHSKTKPTYFPKTSVMVFLLVVLVTIFVCLVGFYDK